MAKYMVNGATLQCNWGDQTSDFQASSGRTVFINGQAQGNINDFAPNKNIMPFGKCQCLQNPAVKAATAAHNGVFTPETCVPNIVSPWKAGKTDELVQGAAALMDYSLLVCQWTGQITVKKDGQSSGFATDGAVGVKIEKTEQETKEQSQKDSTTPDMKKDFQELANKQQQGTPDAKDFEKTVKATYQEFLESHQDPKGGVTVIGLRGWGVGTPCHDTKNIKGERNTYDDMFVVIATNGHLTVFTRCNFEGTTATGTYGGGTLNSKGYPSIANGEYDLVSWIHDSTKPYRDVMLKENGSTYIQTMGQNPQTPGTNTAFGIEIHKGGKDWTWSKGCLTIFAPGYDESRWNKFISNFPNTANEVRVGLLHLMTL